MNEEQQLMRDIQIVSFMLIDTRLFLDTHPDDSQGLSFFDYYNQLLTALVADYESRFGPLTIYDNSANWLDRPWPWEKEA